MTHSEGGTITSQGVPTVGSVSEAIKAAEAERAAEREGVVPDPASGQDITTHTTKDLDAVRERKATTYTVLVGQTESGPYAVHSTQEVIGGQGAARKQAVLGDERLKQRILEGEQFFTVAIANWNPVASEVEKADPEIKV